jgi:long-subunit fatty acid transport protein
MVLAGIFVFLVAANTAHAQTIAQEVDISGSPNPVDSGARALGMGGAFIGVADDATAASWNPGGLIQLETPEVSIVLSYEHRSESRAFLDTPDASGTYSIDLSDLNYISAAYPFVLLGRNMITSLNYQTLYDFNKVMEASYPYTETFPPDTYGIRSAKREIDGYLKALSPAFAAQITPTLSAGFTLNWFSKDLGCEWTWDYSETNIGKFAGFDFYNDLRYYEENTFDGINFNLGILWNINSFLTLGLVYKAPFDADVHHFEAYQVSGTTQNTPYTVILDEDQTMTMPQSYGFGLAWRFSDAFTIDLDVYRTDWQDYYLTQADGRQISLFTGQDRSLSDTEETTQIRLGGEYLFIREKYAIPVRGGVFYDPEPTADSPDDFYGFSLGSGIAYKSIVFDIAYKYRWGDNVRKVRLGQEEVFQDVKQHTVHTSLIYHF